MVTSRGPLRRRSAPAFPAVVVGVHLVETGHDNRNAVVHLERALDPRLEIGETFVRETSERALDFVGGCPGMTAASLCSKLARGTGGDLGIVDVLDAKRCSGLDELDMPSHPADVPASQDAESGTIKGMVDIDGSLGEGGGQVVRTALSLAAVTGTAVEVCNIRAKRQRPGLQPQHLAAVRAAGAICDAELAGDHVGSSHLLFEPRVATRPDSYVFDIRTAGAATLVLQTVLVPLVCAGGESSVEVIGGTHQPMSPAVEYLEDVYAPAIERFGAHVGIDYGPAGYYPRGGGRVRALIGGAPLHGVDLTERGPRRRLDTYVVTSRLPDHVATRGVAAVEALLPDARIEVRSPYAFSSGAAVTVVARHASGLGGFSAIGKPGLPMEDVAKQACTQFLSWDGTQAACDEHLADQLVLPASVACGTSRWTTPRATDHLTTVLSVVERFVPLRFEIAHGLVTLTTDDVARDATRFE
jgi:RNA 3'-terminal phosphate cyclase (ATP)